MTTREKIILGIMSVAVIGGGLHLALPTPAPKNGKPARSPTDLANMLTQVQVAAQEGRLSDREKRILERASVPWAENPFLAQPLAPADPAYEATGDGQELPLYTGFFVIGDKTFAIIDDYHYRENDLLPDGLYRVSRIFPDRVELTRAGDRPEGQVSLLLAEEIDNGQD